MTSDDITKLIRHQIAGTPSLRNSHGVDLDRCLLPPAQITVIERSVFDGKLKDSIEPVWLVLEESPITKDGYKVVFSERRVKFGLASPGFPTDQLPVLCGWYGDFPRALASM